MDSVNGLSRITLVLHWLVAIPMIGMLALGLYMTNLELFDYYDLHKSLGILLGGVIVLRVIWRLRQGWLPPVANYAKSEMLLARYTHWTLIISTLLMPVSGMIMSGASGHGFDVFGLELVRENPDPTHPDKVIAFNEFWSGFGETRHEYAGYILILAIVLHILGALKHQFIYKDAILRRMLGQNTKLK